MTRPLLAIAAGALLFAWPAVLNGYPIVFSDTYGFIEEGIGPYIGWTKPWVYGPAIVPLHLKTTLWPIVAAQAALLSWVLWLLAATLTSRATPLRHVLLCAILAGLTAAPWFASLLMPDIFAPITAIALFLLAYGPTRLSRPTLVAVAALATFAIASHLAHLVLAAACIATLCLLRLRLLWRPTAPLLAALAFLFTSNLVGLGLPAISPFGSIFALARLVGDGPAARVIQRECPAAGWHLCAWKDRLPTDSDVCLWAPDGPVSTGGLGPALAPEAAAIVRETIRTEPLATARAVLSNTLRQLTMAEVGDALIPDYLDITVGDTLATVFPPNELARFRSGLQVAGGLPAVAAPFRPIHAAILLLGTAATLLVALLRRGPSSAFAALVLVALVANAASTGALSGPHDRYAARIAWLVVLPPRRHAAEPSPSARAAPAASRNRWKLRRLNGSIPA